MLFERKATLLSCPRDKEGYRNPAGMFGCRLMAIETLTGRKGNQMSPFESTYWPARQSSGSFSDFGFLSPYSLVYFPLCVVFLPRKNSGTDKVRLRTPGFRGATGLRILKT